MEQIRSRPLAMVVLWGVLVFNGLFAWYVLDPAATPAPASQDVARPNSPPPTPPDAALERFEFRQTHMGSEFKLVLYCADAPTARRASDAAFARIAALDAALSDYDPESELSRLSDASGGPPVRLSDDLYAVLDRALAMARRSGGAFDPTIGPVGRLWRRARRDRRLPDRERLDEALGHVGWQKVALDPDARTARLAVAGMKLDLGGIAKGYASDAAIAALNKEGVTRALVAGAGDVVAADPPPGRDGWTVGIAPLEAPGAAPPARFLALARRAVSTSGDAERFVEIDGVRYSHIVDPHTGVGLTGRSSVTVVAPDGTTADSLATAVSVLGPAKGLPLVEQTEGAAALIVRLGPDGRPETIESARWESLPTAARGDVTGAERLGR